MYGPPFQDSWWIVLKIGTDPLCGDVNDFRNVDDDVPIISYRKSTIAHFAKGSLLFPLLNLLQASTKETVRVHASKMVTECCI